MNHPHRLSAVPGFFDLRRFTGHLIPLLCLFFLSGCSVLFSSAAGELADSLSNAVLDNNDLVMVEAGSPAYLLMIDGLLRDNPRNEPLLRSAATLYTAYTEVFVKDEERARRLSEKAVDYAFRAMCVRRPDACSLKESRFADFEAVIADMNIKDVPVLFALGTAWAGWIQAHCDDWNAIAEISRVEAIMIRVVELDESYQDGGAHLYLGVLSTLIPAPLGGKPESGRIHFERAIEISNGRNLMAKVTYARMYARLIFDRQLHDRLLHEVLEADFNEPGYTLINTLAQRQAQKLLDSSEDYF
ncbi:MAG: TRAP transporter TatT component family protein [Thermodesulfobacteriota bacterium]|nr:TRAP transporter TatT component family protein [Thermodesulfobacteriota bacterium]